MVDQLPLLFELRDEFSLDSYVRDGNEALCRMMLELPQEPAGQMLWLHAARGSGKTHLAQAVVAHLAARGERVAYLPARRAEAVAALEGLQQFQLVVIDDADHWLNNAATEQALVGLIKSCAPWAGTFYCSRRNRRWVTNMPCPTGVPAAAVPEFLRCKN